MRYLLFILFPLCVNAQSDAQTIQLIDGAKAYSNTYLNFNPPFFTRASNGDTITFCFIYHESASTPIDIVRINLSKGTTTTKTLTASHSSAYAIWSYCADSTGNIFIGLNYDRRIWRVNLNDSIYLKNFGVGFLDNAGLMYSSSIGTDANVYFGGSSSPTPCVSYWDKNLDSIIKYTAPDSAQDYILTVQGDENFIYAQAGQNPTNDIWAIRKSDGAKQKLLSVPNSTRFDYKTWGGHCYVQSQGISYKLNGFIEPQVITSTEWNTLGRNQVYGIRTITSFFNSATNGFLYTTANSTLQGTINVNADVIPNTIRKIFFDSSHIGGYDSGFYYVGEYYGTWYHYNNTTHTASILGKLGGNIFTVTQYNDSIFYLGCYPNATYWKWNKNQAWTCNTLVNGRIVDGTLSTDNPHIEVYLRTYGGFHEPISALVDTAGNIVAFGNVIRVGNTCSIAAFNPTTHTAWGYDFNKINALAGTSILRYKDRILMSTNNSFGGHPKLYWYNSVTNQMTDSLDLNYSSYNVLIRKTDTIYGLGSNGFSYKINALTKSVLRTYTNPINTVLGLRFGYAGINTTGVLIDSSWMVGFHYSNAYARDSIAYTVNGTAVYKLSNFYPPFVPPAPPGPGPGDSSYPVPDNQAVIFYPNPATNQVYVIGTGTFYLLSNTGAMLSSREGSGVLSLSGMAAGTYYINFKRLVKR